jgi:murein DD-endopeptidase
MALCGGSLVLNLILVAGFALSGGSTTSDAVVTANASSAAEVAVMPGELIAEEPVALSGEVPDLEEALAKAKEVRDRMPGELFAGQGKVTHSLARTFQSSVKREHADVVAAVFARLFVWDLDLRKDLQKGDEVSVAYTWDGELAHIPVASFTSTKLGKTVKAYEFQITGDTFTSWWDESGQELPRRLINGPLANYEQITSLIKDRPKHKGMDFKAPVGTDVVSPVAGTVTRVNWNLANNGNCVEVKYTDGTFARFLHLSETGAKAGQKVTAGERIGAVGNTGHSTAAHLHYELEKNGKVVDPIDYHGVERRTVPAADAERFAGEKAALESLLAEKV